MVWWGRFTIYHSKNNLETWEVFLPYKFAQLITEIGCEMSGFPLENGSSGNLRARGWF